jgi:hypothetical protein
VVNEFCVVGVFRGLIRHLTRPPATLSPVEAERTQNGWCGGREEFLKCRLPVRFICGVVYLPVIGQNPFLKF